MLCQAEQGGQQEATTDSLAVPTSCGCHSGHLSLLRRGPPICHDPQSANKSQPCVAIQYILFDLNRAEPAAVYRLAWDVA